MQSLVFAVVCLDQREHDRVEESVDFGNSLVKSQCDDFRYSSITRSRSRRLLVFMTWRLPRTGLVRSIMMSFSANPFDMLTPSTLHFKLETANSSYSARRFKSI